VALIDLVVEPFGLRLTQKELVTRHPYPNKMHAVACRRIGKKAIDGILIETPDQSDEFSTMARWAIEAQMVVSHWIEYRSVDREFDAASDKQMLWHGTYGDLGDWSDRTLRNDQHSPMMQLERDMKTGSDVVDEFDAASGFITRRIQPFDMPTIERGRILECRMFDRIPRIKNAFII
jgi:hypothetical protein